MKKILVLCLLLLSVIFLIGCDQSQNVNNNLRTAEGNFNVYRRVTVVNLRSDKVLFEVEGYLAIDIDRDGDLNITIRISASEYKLHYIGLAPELTYFSEQLENTSTNPYHWEISIFAVKPVIKK